MTPRSDLAASVDIARDRAEMAKAQLLHNILPEARNLDPHGPLPPLAHWLFFPTPTKLTELGPDGHPSRGGLIPDNGLPRRMWAGSRIEFLAPIGSGDQMTRRTSVLKTADKQGKSGRLCFVTLQHLIEAGGQLCVREEQDLVYRQAHALARDRPTAIPGELPGESDFQENVSPDPVMLFRYSALTYNGHRIHYDRDYAVGAEGYRGLVVHGPLIATLLLDLALRNNPQGPLRSYRFKATNPLFDTDTFRICGKRSANGAELWAQSSDGVVALTAEATLA